MTTDITAPSETRTRKTGRTPSDVQQLLRELAENESGIPVVTYSKLSNGGASEAKNSGYRSLGEVLAAALDGPTHSFNALVGYFAHRNIGDSLSPDRLIAGEIEDDADGDPRYDEDWSGFRLAFGEIVSYQAQLAIQAWYWLCRWKESGATIGGKTAGEWREQLLNGATGTGRERTELAAELLETDFYPLAHAEEFCEQVELNDPEREFFEKWRTECCERVDSDKKTKTKAAGAISQLLFFMIQRQADIRYGDVIGTFHPKLYIVERDTDDEGDSVVAMGSGNWSARAFVHGKGNVEIGTAHRVAGHAWTATAGETTSKLGSRLSSVGAGIFDQCLTVARWTDGSNAVCCSLGELREWTNVDEAKAKEFANVRGTDPDEEGPPDELPADFEARKLAMLGLRRLIATRVGFSKLNETVDADYIQTEYQRQGAQRLLHKLEDPSLRGGMLCDGTGLGKTYVATALIAHYAREWDFEYQAEWTEWDGNPRGDGKEFPFRMTVIVPSSVERTWKNEALASLQKLGVPLHCIQVLTHGSLQDLRTPNRTVLKPSDELGGLSPFEHLILSDFVIVDEAHNFRARDAVRTRILREVLRIQPHKLEHQGNQCRHRRVLLLTATPINNGLRDLEQQASLFLLQGEYPPAKWPKAKKLVPTGKEYREHLEDILKERIEYAREHFNYRGEVHRYDLPSVIVYGHKDGYRRGDGGSNTGAFPRSPSYWINAQTLGLPKPLPNYLKDEEERLQRQTQVIKSRYMESDEGEAREESTEVDATFELDTSIADELLDLVVVQRSRQRCEKIEEESEGGMGLDTMFRSQTDDPPERLTYADEDDSEMSRALAKMLELFDRGGEGSAEDTGEDTDDVLSLAVYLWDVFLSASEENVPDPEDAAAGPMVHLQRMLLLKRMESSTVSFLISMLRLVRRHASRLHEFLNESAKLGKSAPDEAAEVRSILESAVRALDQAERERLFEMMADVTGTGASTGARGAADDIAGFLGALSRNFKPESADNDTDDAAEATSNLELFESETEQPESEEEAMRAETREALERLAPVAVRVARDFAILLDKTPTIASLILGEDTGVYPRGFVDPESDARWSIPRPEAWARRLVSDAKLQTLFGRIARAALNGQKVIVFSQFTDTIFYIQSVLRNCTSDNASLELRKRLAGNFGLDTDQFDTVLKHTASVTGAQDPETRDPIVDRFAPYYRIGFFEGAGDTTETLEEWQERWKQAEEKPIDVLFTTDILAEGVNLQDVAVLVNLDIHWNPVRMLQRAGRIDRRLRPEIEEKESPGFHEFRTKLGDVGVSPPDYWWHTQTDGSPTHVNMLLPDKLERELHVREIVSEKTLLIDATLGLNGELGVEADWMEQYKHNGVRSLEGLEDDRTLEELAQRLKEIDGWLIEYEVIDEEASPESLEEMLFNDSAIIWIRSESASDDSPMFGDITVRHKSRERRWSRVVRPELTESGERWPYRGKRRSCRYWRTVTGYGTDLAGKDPAAAVEEDERRIPLVNENLVSLWKVLSEPHKAELQRETDPEVIQKLLRGVESFADDQFGFDPSQTPYFLTDDGRYGLLKAFVLQIET